jgi:hypothetical protein
MKANESHTELLPLADLQRYLADPTGADEALRIKVAGYALDPTAVTIVPPVHSFSAGLATKTGLSSGWQSLLWRLSAWLVISGTLAGIGYALWPSKKSENNSSALVIVASTESSPASSTSEVAPSYSFTAPSESVSNTMNRGNSDSSTTRTQTIPDTEAIADHGGPMPMELKAAPALRTTDAILKDPNLEVIVSSANSISKGLTAVIVTRYQGQKYADYASLRSGWYYPIPTDSSVALTYDDLVKRAMDSSREKRYQEVLDLLSPVFINYPNDVNVQLLTGLALQGLSDHYNAERWLGFASVNKISAFREQAMYCRAQSLRELGREEEARQLYQKVADMGGEYQEAAWTVLYKGKP